MNRLSIILALIQMAWREAGKNPQNTVKCSLWYDHDLFRSCGTSRPAGARRPR